MKRHAPSGEQDRGERHASQPTFAGALRARRPLRPARFRLVCGALAAGLLGMLAIGTLREAGAVYREPWPAGAGELHLPALPPPPFPKDLGPDGEVKERVRFLLHVVVAPLDFGLEPRPRPVREIDVEWPRDRGRVIVSSVSFAGGLLSRGLKLESVRSGTFQEPLLRRQAGVERPYDWMSIECSGSSELQGSWSWSSGDDISLSWTDTEPRVGEQQEREEYENDLAQEHCAWSMVPRRTPGRIEFGLIGQRVALNDPLVPAGAEVLPAEIPLRDVHRSSSSRHGRPTFPPGALSYIGHVRWGLVPLLASVLLLSQTFRRRELAFLGLLLAAVLLGAAADRYTVGVHFGRLADSAAPAEERALALDSLETTFFYRPGALAAARRVAGDEAEPELLRRKAASAVTRLEAR